VADDVVHQLKHHGDPWRLSEELPPPKRTLHAVMAWLMRTRHLNALLMIGVLIISTAPLYAQREQQNIAKLKADARSVVGTIANDEAKTQAYWQVVDLGRQLGQADNEKDRKKGQDVGREDRSIAETNRARIPHVGQYR